jgi:uncharacterized protein YndB with AHSA1/START domain
MEPLVSTIEIARPPAQVYAFATDPGRFPQWQRDVVAVELRGEREFATVRRFAGARRTVVQQITRVDPPHAWAAHGSDGPIRPHATVTVEPVRDGTASRVTFTLGFEGHGLGIPLVPLVLAQARKAAPSSYRNLQRLLEEGS